MAKYNAKLTPEVCKIICEALAKGHSIIGACGYAGISESTYHNWYDRGKEAKSGKYKQFVYDVDKAKAQATCGVEDVIIDAIPSDVTTAKWWLTKHHSEIYGNKTSIESKVEAKDDVEIKAPLEDALLVVNRCRKKYDDEKKKELDD